MPKVNQIDRYRDTIIAVLKENDVKRAGIFGSFARNEAKKSSDIDILIEFKKRKSLFDLAHLENELEKRSGRKVDVITYKSIHPLLKERILSEEVKIL